MTYICVQCGTQLALCGCKALGRPVPTPVQAADAVSDCIVIGMKECHVHSLDDIDIGKSLKWEVMDTDEALVIKSEDDHLYVIGWGLLDTIFEAYQRRRLGAFTNVTLGRPWPE